LGDAVRGWLAFSLFFCPAFLFFLMPINNSKAIS